VQRAKGKIDFRKSILFSLFSFLSTGMNVQHFEQGFSYSDGQLIIVARKLGKLATYCKRLKDEASVIRVESDRRATKKDRDEVKVAVTVDLPKSVLRAESRRKDPVEALDRCIEKLEPQVKRYKEKHTPSLRSRVERRHGK
jgi:ribosomal subunit interface protein